MKFILCLFISIIFHSFFLSKNSFNLKKESQIIPNIKISLKNDFKKNEINEKRSIIYTESFLKESKVIDLTKTLGSESKEELSFYEKIRTRVYNNWKKDVSENYNNIKKKGLKETLLAVKLNSYGEIVDKVIKDPSISSIADNLALKVFSKIHLPMPPINVIGQHKHIVLIMAFSIP